MDSGAESEGEFGNELWAEFCAERSVRLHFQGKGAHTWLKERRSGLSQGIRDRLAAGGHFSSRAMLNEVQLRLKTMLRHGEFSAHQLAFGPNPVDL